jgi:hypothetical protein
MSALLVGKLEAEVQRVNALAGPVYFDPKSYRRRHGSRLPPCSADLPPGLGNFGPFNEHLCPSGGKTRLAKNTYGADFHLLSAGSNRACHLLS